MGNWGTSIKSNDTFTDIYGQFFDLYDDGMEVSAITLKLIAEHQDIINDPDDGNNFWFALSKAQWECKQLDTTILNRVKEIIQTSADLKVWRHLDADKKDIEKRKVILDKFLAEILSERPKAKGRRKKVINNPVFAKGDCLTFKLENGNYGGAIVLEAIYNTECGHNLIATTRINQVHRPTLKDFETADLLISNFGNWKDKEDLHWYNPIRYKPVAHLIERVCNIKVELTYDINNTMLGFVSDFDLWIIGQADKQFQFEQTNKKPTVKRTIKELTKKKWKLW